MGEGWGGDGEGKMGWDGPCVGGQKEEKEEKRRAPSFNPVDLGRAWQATSHQPAHFGDLTNGSACLFFLPGPVHRPAAQPESLPGNRDKLAAK